MTRTGEGRRASPFLFAMSDLHEKVRHTIKKFDLLRAGDTVVVAVSGGADSVALLHLLRGLQDEYALALHIAHLTHRLRPAARRGQRSAAAAGDPAGGATGIPPPPGDRLAR